MSHAHKTGALHSWAKYCRESLTTTSATVRVAPKKLACTEASTFVWSLQILCLQMHTQSRQTHALLSCILLPTHGFAMHTKRT